MSRLAEMVEAEAAAAEAENPDEPSPEPEPEPVPEPSPEPEPEPYAAIGPEEIRKAERARDAYRKKISDILGPESVAHECLLCAGLGFLPDLPPAGTTFSIVLTEEGPQLLAEEPRSEPPYKDALDKATCDDCDGYGFVLTGAKTEHGRVAACTKCSGNGWMMVARPEPQAPAYAPPLPSALAPNYQAVNGPGPDAWGRAPGHVHWGVPPAQIPG